MRSHLQFQRNPSAVSFFPHTMALMVGRVSAKKKSNLNKKFPYFLDKHCKQKMLHANAYTFSFHPAYMYAYKQFRTHILLYMALTY